MLGKDFEKELYQIYDQKNHESQKEVQDYHKEFRQAIYLMDTLDQTIGAVPKDLMDPNGQQLIADLDAASGQFKAIASTL